MFGPSCGEETLRKVFMSHVCSAIDAITVAEAMKAKGVPAWLMVERAKIELGLLRETLEVFEKDFSSHMRNAGGKDGHGFDC